MPDIVATTASAYILPYAVAAVMPNWRWLLAVTLIVALPVTTDWSRHWIIPFICGTNTGSCCMIGMLLLFVATVGFAAGVTIRALTLLLGSRGVRRRAIITICVAGSVIAPVIITLWP